MVKFTTKKDKCYYVGRVVKNIDEFEFKINFLQRCQDSFNFVYPDNEDISVVQIDDMTKLPYPISSGGTECFT